MSLCLFVSKFILLVLVNIRQKQLVGHLLQFDVITQFLPHKERYHMPELMACSDHNLLINTKKLTLTELA